MAQAIMTFIQQFFAVHTEAVQANTIGFRSRTIWIVNRTVIRMDIFLAATATSKALIGTITNGTCQN